MKRSLAAIALGLVASLGVASCASDQDPGLTPTESTSDGPGTTSHVLPTCPPGGPDASTPAGCIGDGGKVLHPT